MKKFSVLLYCMFVSVFSFSQSSKTEIAIIPKPVSVVEKQGLFSLPQNIVIEAGTQPQLKETIAFLKDRLSNPTGHSVDIKNTAPSATVRLILNTKTESSIGKEGYRLSVSPQQIVIAANEPAGLFYGVQTLMQLFPKEIESKTQVVNINWELPAWRSLITQGLAGEG